MFGSTTLLTVGHALDRAMDEGLPVRLHVGGEWISGRVVSHDGHGVAILEGNGDMCVFRPEAITGVRIPHRGPEARAHEGAERPAHEQREHLVPVPLAAHIN
jgi:hypothetical protein